QRVNIAFGKSNIEVSEQQLFRCVPAILAAHDPNQGPSLLRANMNVCDVQREWGRGGLPFSLGPGPSRGRRSTPLPAYQMAEVEDKNPMYFQNGNTYMC